MRLAALLLLAALWPASAQATTIIAPEGSPFPYQQWADEAKVATPDVALEVIATLPGDGCPGRDAEYAACTQPVEGKIWLVESELIGKHPKRTFLHELGHNVDFYLLPEWMRSRYMEIMGLGGPWRVIGEPEPPNNPSELFADSWAECAVKPRIPVAAGEWLGQGPIFQGEPVGGIQGHNAACRMLAKL